MLWTLESQRSHTHSQTYIIARRPFLSSAMNMYMIANSLSGKHSYGGGQSLNSVSIAGTSRLFHTLFGCGLFDWSDCASLSAGTSLACSAKKPRIASLAVSG